MKYKIISSPNIKFLTSETINTLRKFKNISQEAYLKVLLTFLSNSHSRLIPKTLNILWNNFDSEGNLIVTKEDKINKILSLIGDVPNDLFYNINDCYIANVNLANNLLDKFHEHSLFYNEIPILNKLLELGFPNNHNNKISEQEENNIKNYWITKYYEKINIDEPFNNSLIRTETNNVIINLDKTSMNFFIKTKNYNEALAYLLSFIGDTKSQELAEKALKIYKGNFNSDNGNYLGTIPRKINAILELLNIEKNILSVSEDEIIETDNERYLALKSKNTLDNSEKSTLEYLQNILNNKTTISESTSSNIHRGNITTNEPGTIRIEKDNVVRGDIKNPGGTIILEAGSVVRGNITAGTVTLEAGSVVREDITAEGTVTLKTDSVVRGNITAKKIIIGKNVVTKGEIFAENIIYE